MSDRSFMVGESVLLRVRVSKPGSRRPTDAGTVVLTSLRRGTTNVGVTTTAFTRVAEGEYELLVPTVGFTAGTYSLVVTVQGGPEKIVMVTDQFILSPSPI